MSEENEPGAATLSEPEAKPTEPTKPNYSLWALLIGFAAILIPVGVVISRDEGQALFLLKSWGIAAGLLAAIASGVRLAAHNGDKNLDGFGKMLGFTASVIAVFAVIALAFLNPS